MALNKVMIMGRLARDPEVSYGGSMPVCRITVAVDEPKRSGEAKPDTSFIPCKAFGKTAELIGNYFQKGNRIIVSDGRLKVESYTDKAGAKKTSFGVIINSVEFVDGKGGTKGGNTSGGSSFSSFGEEVDF